jgi:hypothetical protein
LHRNWDDYASGRTEAGCPECVAGAIYSAGVAIYEGAAALFGSLTAVTSEGTADAFQYQLLKEDLLYREASSTFTETGELQQEVINESKMIIDPTEIGNSEIPSGFGKYTTPMRNSPSGPFTTRFYMNPDTGETFYGLDYKSLFK